MIKLRMMTIKLHMMTIKLRMMMMKLRMMTIMLRMMMIKLRMMTIMLRMMTIKKSMMTIKKRVMKIKMCVMKVNFRICVIKEPYFSESRKMLFRLVHNQHLLRNILHYNAPCLLVHCFKQFKFAFGAFGIKPAETAQAHLIKVYLFKGVHGAVRITS
jgi:hypothetical protein